MTRKTTLTRVAVTMRVVKDPRHGEIRDALSHDWYPLLKSLGIAPLLVPNLEDAVADCLDGIDLAGVILTSGNNLCPETYRAHGAGACGFDGRAFFPTWGSRRDRGRMRLCRLLPAVGGRPVKE